MRNIYIMLSVFTCAFLWSIYNPKDNFTCFLEIIPAIIGLSVLAFTFKRFRFTDFVYLLILIHCIILFVGGHYTYAEVPFFNFIKEIFHQDRNNFDKIGHFAQGFVPAMIIREIFIRQSAIQNKKYFGFIVVCICTAISAAYEWIEWWVSLFSGESVDAFLGTQGYIWDTQSDMLLAAIGATTALVFLSKIHDNQLRKQQIQISEPTN